MSIVYFLIILTLLVLVHECGHFFMARKMRVSVEEFGVGFPPRALGFKKGGTRYSINWIPLGGFVKIKGEQGDHSQDPDSFVQKKIWQRSLILCAGVLMNIVLAFILFTVGYTFGIPSATEGVGPRAIISDQRIQIVEVVASSPAEKASLKPGDIITDVDNQHVSTISQFRQLIQPLGGKEVYLRVLRANTQLSFALTPVADSSGKGIIGAGLYETGVVRYPFFSAFWEGAKTTGIVFWQILVAVYTLVRNLFIGHAVQLDVAGPVGIAVLTGQVARLGFIYLLQFAALLSLNLAFINILPFPALDGGRLFFLLIEKLRRKPVSRKVESIIHNVGFALLMVLVLLVTIKDVTRLSGAISSFVKGVFGT